MSPAPTKLSTSKIPPFGVRMGPDLKTKIEESAKANGRSMNAEIIARLEASFAIGSDEMNDQTQKYYNLLQGELRELKARITMVEDGFEKKGLLPPKE